MLDKVRKLHELRQRHAQHTKALRQSRQQWENENAGLLALRDEVAIEIATLETKLRQQRVAEYDGKDKSPFYGVGIREKTVLYYLETDAYNWALEHKLCLRLDTKPFERLAKDGSMDFVTIDKKLEATIASDLSKWE